MKKIKIMTLIFLFNSDDNFEAPLPAKYAAPRTTSTSALASTKNTMLDISVNDSLRNPTWPPTGRVTWNS